MRPINSSIDLFSTASSSTPNIQETSSGVHPTDVEGTPPETPGPSRPSMRRPTSQALVSDAQGRLVVVSNRPGAPKEAAEGTDGLDTPTLESAREVYEENRLYHGTGARSKSSIQENGFRHEHKVDGGSAAAISAGSIESQGKHKPSYHYLTTEKRRADRYALAAESDSPAIVRTIGVRHDLPLEHIMGVDRTSSDIPPEYVVGLKRSNPGPESAIFQKALKRANINVSLQEAGQLLRKVQSDSESDFSSDDDSE